MSVTIQQQLKHLIIESKLDYIESNLQSMDSKLDYIESNLQFKDSSFEAIVPIGTVYCL